MRGALFLSLKDNVSYEETGTKYKRDREYAGLWVSGDSFCRFTAVYAEQAGDDRKCKIFVFPEYYAGAGGFCGAGCAVAEDPGRTDNETDVEENGCVYAVVSGVCNLFLGTAVLQILKWMLKIVLGALKLFLGLVRLVLLLFCLIARVFLSFVRMGTF